MKRLHTFCLTLLLCSFLSSPLAAQTYHGTITGLVQDATGAVLPGAKITATDPATGRVWSALTGDDGIYRLINLPAAAYDLEAELSGFKKAVRRGVKLDVGQVLRLDFALEVGEIEEVVQVVGTPPAIDMEKAEVSAVVGAEKIANLPLNGRNVYQLAELQPGIIRAAGAVAQSDVTFAGFSASGTRFRDNNVMIDGVSNNNDRQGGLVTITPNVDIVQEFRVVTNNISAEFGRSAGGVVNMVTKSGTNDFHGSVYAFHRNDNLDSADTFENQRLAALRAQGREAKKSEFKRNQFGWTLGGPVIKNRTFFFTSYEGLRRPGGVSRSVVVETPEFREFVIRTRPNSIAARLFKEFPASVTPNTNIRDIGSPAPGANVFGPPDGIPDIGEGVALIPGFFNSDQFSIKLDHEWEEGRSRLAARYLFNDLREQRPGDNSVRGFLTFFDERDQNLGINYTRVFSPKVINEFRFGFNRDPISAVPNFPEIPDITLLDGTAKFSQGFGYAIPLFFFLNTFHYSDVVTINAGKHGIKIGGEARRFQENSDFQLFTRGWYFFANVLDLADDEPLQQFARVDPNTGDPVGTPRGFRDFEWAVFFQDDWKVTPHLTLNLGIRYENFGTLKEINGRLSNLIFGPGTSVRERIAGASIRAVDELYQTDNNNFGPRFGFAWDPSRTGRMAIRGGFGMMYSRIWSNLTGNNRFNPPFSATAVGTAAAGTIRYGIPIPPNPAFRRGFDPRGGLAGVRDNLDGTFDTDFPAPYVYNYFFGVQLEPFREWVLEINYLGISSHKQNLIQNINRFSGDLLDGRLDRLNPEFGLINHRLNVVNGNYNGLTLQVNKRMSRSYTFQAAYTLSKNIDVDSDPFNTAAFGDDRGTVDVENIRLDRGLASFDVTHRFAANFVWDLPSLSGASRALRQALGGWHVNGIIALQSGFPFSVFTTAAAGDYNADGNLFDRPNQPAFGNSLGSVSTSDWLKGAMNRADFPAPAQRGVNGDLGRNTFRGPGFASVDFGLYKDFPIPWFAAEGAKLQLRAEFFNLFNRVNLGRPVSNLNLVNFGRITTLAGTARQLQFALKFLF